MPQFKELRLPPYGNFWDNEEDFSSWLAFEENIHHLQNTLGLHGLAAKELELEVEGYRVDIFAEDKTFDVQVVVENQFGKSDHEHWGKANTYTSNLDADVIVWIAGEFTRGHIQAVVDHNQTAERAVFALRAEVVQIEGCNEAAFRLLPIVEPTDWPYPEKPLALYQERFWEEFVSMAKDQGRDIVSNEDPSHHSDSITQAFHTPISEDISIDCSVTFRATNNGLSVELQIDEDDEHALFDELSKQRDDFEEQIQDFVSPEPSTIWERGNGNIRDKIVIPYPVEGFDIKRVNEFEVYIEWLLEVDTALRKAFMEPIGTFDLDN